MTCLGGPVPMPRRDWPGAMRGARWWSVVNPECATMVVGPRRCSDHRHDRHLVMIPAAPVSLREEATGASVDGFA